MKARTFLALVVACAIGFTSCASNPSPSASGARSTEADSSLTMFDSDFGPALADDKGFTLYGYDDDTGGEIKCVANCATIFPPMPATSLRPGSGIDANLIGSVVRPDELGEQLTYAGRPLYRFSGDNLPGDALGVGSGGRWWLVSATGERLTG